MIFIKIKIWRIFINSNSLFELFYFYLKKWCNLSGVRANLSAWAKKLDCHGDIEKQSHFKKLFIQRLRNSPVAIDTEKANEQHYEVPTEFFTTVCFQYTDTQRCAKSIRHSNFLLYISFRITILKVIFLQNLFLFDFDQKKIDLRISLWKIVIWNEVNMDMFSIILSDCFLKTIE